MELENGRDPTNRLDDDGDETVYRHNGKNNWVPLPMSRTQTAMGSMMGSKIETETACILSAKLTPLFAILMETASKMALKTSTETAQLILGKHHPDSDSDEDGLLDGAEDTNQNGILDFGETDPRVADTDGDGLSDSDDNHPLIPYESPTLVSGEKGCHATSTLPPFGVFYLLTIALFIRRWFKIRSFS